MPLNNETKLNQDKLIECGMKRVSYLPTPPLGQDMTQGQFLSGV